MVNKTTLASNSTAPATRAVAIDAVSEDIDIIDLYGCATSSIAIGLGGTLCVDMIDNSDGYVTLPEFPDGHIWKIQAKAIYVEGTTASDMVLFFNRRV